MMTDFFAYYLACAFLMPGRCPCTYTEPERQMVVRFALMLTKLPPDRYYPWEVGSA